MAYDDAVAARVRATLDRQPARGAMTIEEKKMFGGLAFMVGGSMCVGVLGDELMVRVGPEGHGDALARPHARKMDFTGRSLAGFVYVAPPGFAIAADLDDWVGRGVAFVESLPRKGGVKAKAGTKVETRSGASPRRRSRTVRSRLGGGPGDPT